MKKAPVTKRTLPTRHILQSTKDRFTALSSKTVRFVDRRPLTSFFAVLAALVVLIVLSNVINRPQTASEETQKPVKPVSAYRIGSAPKISVAAQTKKSGVIEIASINGGIIDTINVQEGQTVDAGTKLVSMSSNYKGENTATVQRQIAGTRYQGLLATFPKQKEIIERQKELAENEEENSEELRKITERSLDETRSLVQQNEEFLRFLQEQLNMMTPAFSEEYLTLKGQVLQLQATVNQGRQGLRSDEYTAGEDNPPAEKAELTKEIAKRQLDVELKQLQVSLAVSGLESRLAQINENAMFPSAPFAGVVQRVLVKEKQQVGQGTALIILSQVAEEKPVTAVAYVSADVAKKVSRIEPSTIHIGEKITYTTIPTFVSTEAVQGTLYAVYYPIPQEHSDKVTDKGFITIDIPVGTADTTMIATYIPLDAVYQTREKAYVFVTRGNVAQSKTIQLGHVYGGYVEVTDGLKNGDTIILNRNIIEGDVVTVQ